MSYKAIEAAWLALEDRCTASAKQTPRKPAERIVLFSKDDLRSAIAAYERALWQPIETVPKDCRCWLFEGKLVLSDSVTAYGEYIWRRVGGGAHDFVVENPTHWRPLPPPPTGERA